MVLRVWLLDACNTSEESGPRWIEDCLVRRLLIRGSVALVSVAMVSPVVEQPELSQAHVVPAALACELCARKPEASSPSKVLGQSFRASCQNFCLADLATCADTFKINGS